MRVVVQRASNVSILIDNKETRSIDKGLVVLLGITKDDNENDIDYIIKKITNLRIFEDDNEKMNYSVKDIKGSLMIVSQFTLYADTKKGNRPFFGERISFEDAKKIYDVFIEKLKQEDVSFTTGKFGSDMRITLTNEGPVTIIIDSRNTI
ncbi:MAG: D-tyrosyl-tRNA(Tyr) deacylase [Bacilli bacterium]|nr:D-tyrosyl-tRNA(Tyr) deacylase [Bacilli bacterium]